MKKVISAIKCTQNNKDFYVAVFSSDVLKKMCFVSRRNENPTSGFQRLLSTSRADNIRDYLDKEKEVIPTAVILSAQKSAKFTFDEENQKLSFNVIEQGLLIIDGQHRLYGMFKSENTYQIPVVIFNELTLKEEVKLFIDINTTQKGVPSALLLDIKNLTGRESTTEERQRALFNNMDNDSVLSGFLLANKSAAGKISRTVFNESTKSIFESSAFKDYTDEVIYNMLKNYLQAMDYTFQQSQNPDAKITKSVFFRASLNVFTDSCEKVVEQYGDLKVDSFIKYLAPIADMEFSSYTGSNNATVAKATNEMKSLLKPKIILSGDMF